MLSTPPAFNLSQNQTLQFKSVQRFLFRKKIGAEIRISKFFFPFALQLSMNKLCRRSLRRGALCPFVVRLSRTFFRFVTFFQNVVKSVKLFSAAGNVLIGLCFPPCQALFETFAKFLLQTWFPGTDRLCMPINVCSPSCKGRACQIFVGTYRGLGYPVVCVRQPLSGGARSASTLVHPACQQKSAPFSKFFSQGPNLSSWGQTNRP